MGLILCIETATKTCSVCLAENGKVANIRTINSENYSHAEKLNLLIVDLLKEANIKMTDLDAIAVSKGPGSYTGLRIGTSTAKGFCYALDIPLIAINSLMALAALKKGTDAMLCPMFDARRMEVYSSVFSTDLEVLEETKAVVVDEASYLPFLLKGPVCFFGPGAEKCQEVIQHPNAVFDLETGVSAAGMALLAEEKLKDADVEDTAYFEPFYLKDFIAGTPKKIF